MAPFEYTAMLSAIIWGLVVFGDRPDVGQLAGAAIIVASGAYAITRARSLP